MHHDDVKSEAKANPFVPKRRLVEFAIGLQHEHQGRMNKLPLSHYVALFLIFSALPLQSTSRSLNLSSSDSDSCFAKNHRPARTTTFTMPHRHRASRHQAVAFASKHIDGDMILSMLSRMTSYFCSMVDPNTNRFYYRCLPTSGRRIHGHCPVRDLGSAWDTATLLNFWSHSETQPESYKATSNKLSDAVTTTINAYNGPLWLAFTDSHNRRCVSIPSKVLREPSTIAHSAFLVLASVGARRLSILDPKESNVPIDSLVGGILSMQQSDTGAFATQFGDDDIYRGIEFYPGEAMLALLDAFEISGNMPGILSPATRTDIIPAVQRAFLFYSDYYHQGYVSEHYTSFFGNWQAQCFSKLFVALEREEMKHALRDDNVTSSVVANYLFELCDPIIMSDPWQLLRKGQFAELSTVEIACGLEAIADGCRVALELYSESVSLDSAAQERLTRYWQYVESAVRFLSVVQNAVPVGVVGSGGLCYALNVPEQRLDVTGHAVNALIKVYNVHNTLSPHVTDKSTIVT